MAERNVKEKPRTLPHKIELRLAELVQLGDFDQDDVTHCRRTYWSARDDWHRSWSTALNGYRSGGRPGKETASRAPNCAVHMTRTK